MASADLLAEETGPGEHLGRAEWLVVHGDGVADRSLVRILLVRPLRENFPPSVDVEGVGAKLHRAVERDLSVHRVPEGIAALCRNSRAQRGSSSDT